MNGNSKKASIKDVAQVANVSVATVSRYFNDRAHVSHKLCGRIEEAVNLLDYHPNPIARALVFQSLSSVAVFTSDPSKYGAVQVLKGISQRARESGYMVNVVLLGESPHTSHASIDQLLSSNPVGAIAIDFNDDDVTMEFSKYLRTRIPTVVVGERMSGDSDIALDAFRGGYQLTKYLLDKGHKTVFHVSGTLNSGPKSRLSGWRCALSEAKRPVPAPIMSFNSAFQAEMIGQRLAKNPNVKAIFAANDELAAGVIRGITDMGKKVPDDIDVVGFDDNPIASLMIPRITTWKQDFQFLGRAAMRHLLGDAPEKKQHEQSCLVERESVSGL